MLGGDCFLCWIDISLYDHVVIHMQETVIGGISVLVIIIWGVLQYLRNVHAYDSIRQTCVQRRLVPREMNSHRDCELKSWMKCLLILVCSLSLKPLIIFSPLLPILNSESVDQGFPSVYHFLLNLF